MGRVQLTLDEHLGLGFRAKTVNTKSILASYTGAFARPLNTVYFFCLNIAFLIIFLLSIWVSSAVLNA